MSSHVDAPDWSTIPDPPDDGAAGHLSGLKVPSIPLPATDGTTVDLSALAGLVVVFAYPRTGLPGVENPPGWDLIPGARGCTPQSCGFRDHFAELKALGVGHLFGLSTQDSALPGRGGGPTASPVPDPVGRAPDSGEGVAAADLRDERHDAPQAPDPGDPGRGIEYVFYPVFPPDRHAGDVVAWLSAGDR